MKNYTLPCMCQPHWAQNGIILTWNHTEQNSTRTKIRPMETVLFIIIIEEHLQFSTNSRTHGWFDGNIRWRRFTRSCVLLVVIFDLINYWKINTAMQSEFAVISLLSSFLSPHRIDGDGGVIGATVRALIVYGTTWHWSLFSVRPAVVRPLDKMVYRESNVLSTNKINTLSTLDRKANLIHSIFINPAVRKKWN